MEKNKFLTKFLTGTIKRHPDGFGFFIPDDREHPDVYIPRNSMKSVMSGDKLEIQVFAEKNSDRFRGEVVRVIEHGTKQVVGRFFKLNSTTGILRDEGKGWGEDLKIKLEDSMNAQEKELVTAEIISYPGEKSFTGKVVQVIGDAAEPLNDITRVLATNNIPVEFSKATLDEAKHFRDQPEEKDFKGRRDLRDMDLITIDGATAKDFDDAVYVETNRNGFLLYVAIADVSHYVRPGTAIDKDAYERGTSVYFPNYVVPMLPEVLSNGLCSLNPRVPRLCLVAEMQMDFNGELMSSSFYEAVMESKARVTYGEAQEVIDGHDAPKLAHVREGILRLADLAKILMAKRFREGSLDLEIPETTMVIDALGIPTDIIKTKRLFSHRLIEEMMLSANVAVAKFLAGKEIPAIYRIHEPPNELAIKILEKYLITFGGKVKLESGKLQKRLTKALEEFAGKPESQVLNILTLRSMSQAKYHLENVGHFGLGFEFYTHFTSPIRRYPDLIVHRLIKSQVMKNSGYSLISEDDIATAGTVLSAAEQRSVKAERQVQSIKKARFMEKFVGRELDGIISSVAKFGIFVLLREFDVDGMVRIDDLAGGEKYEFDEENLRLVAKRSGFSYNIGDIVHIQVASVDVEEGKINFILSEAEDSKAIAGGARATRPDTRREQGRKPSKHDRSNRNEKRPDKRGESRPTRDRDTATTARSERNGPVEKPSAPRGRMEKFFDKFRSKGKGKDNGNNTTAEDSRPTAKPAAKSESVSRDERPQRNEKNQERPKNNPRPGQKISAPASGSSRPGGRDHRKGSGPRGMKPAPVRPTNFEKPAPRPDTGPNEDLLKMILGPDEYKKALADQKNKPKVSQKLKFAEKSKLQNDDDLHTENENSVTSKSGNSNRKNPQERGTAKNDRGSVRKTRVSQRGGKGKAR